MKNFFWETRINPFFFPHLLYFSIFIIIVIIPKQLLATNVGGMISENVIWDLSGSPYDITTELQVKDGITLTIKPGVEVNGNGNKIINAGRVLASGLTDSIIVFKNVVFENANDRRSALLDFDYCHLNNGSSFNGISNGSLLIKNSILDGSRIGVIFLLGIVFGSNEKVELTGNIFIDIGALVLQYSTINSVRIVNNVFIGDSCLYAKTSGYIRYNSFLNTEIEAITIKQYGENLNATNNFWNTTDINIIESMIFDGNDDLNITGYVTFDPFLTAPHPDTPLVAKAHFTAAPKVGKVPLKVNFMDQSAGKIVSWEWDFGDGSKSSEQNPSHIYEQISTYTVTLTVIDNLGLKDTYSQRITLRDKVPMPWIPLLLSELGSKLYDGNGVVLLS